MSHIYEDRYYDYIDVGSFSSAVTIIPILRSHIAIRSVLDVGCGRGAWLRGWLESGVNDFFGVDGSYVQVDKLPFSPDHFSPVDLVQPFDLNRKFDLVQCLEVAEHLPLVAADTLLNSIVRHGDVVLFSAAVPGQGGEFHINEQPLGFWVKKFAERGFEAWDVIRPKVKRNRGVEPWYRYNILVFTKQPLMNASSYQRFPVRGYRTPVIWRLRTSLIRLLPRPAVDWLARAKHAWIRQIRRI